MASVEARTLQERVAASVLWRALVIVAGLHAYWALGGTWAIHAASGGQYSEATTDIRVQSAVMVAVLLVACLVVRVRAGLWRAPVSDRVVRVAMWLLTVALVLAALGNLTAQTNWERYGIGPLVLVLAILALVVAGAGRRWRLHRREGPLPSH